MKFIFWLSLGGIYLVVTSLTFSPVPFWDDHLFYFEPLGECAWWQYWLWPPECARAWPGLHTALALVRALQDLNPNWVFGALNHLLHFFNALLVAQLSRPLGSRSAALAAIIFLFHPLAIFTTSWAFQFANLLSVSMILLFFLTLKSAKSPLAQAMGATALFFLSLAFKPWPIALSVLPLQLYKTSKIWLLVAFCLIAMSGYSWTLTQRGVATFPIEKEHAAHYPLEAPPLPPYLIPVPPQVAPEGKRVNTFDRSLVFTSLVIENFAFYLSKLILPIDLKLIYPPHNNLSFLSTLLFLLCLVAAFRFKGHLKSLIFKPLWKDHPLALGLWLFAAGLLPILGFFYIPHMKYTPVSNHWAYFLLPGYSIILAALAKPLHAKAKALTLWLYPFLLFLGFAYYLGQWNLHRGSFLQNNLKLVPESKILPQLIDQAK